MHSARRGPSAGWLAVLFAAATAFWVPLVSAETPSQASARPDPVASTPRARLAGPAAANSPEDWIGYPLPVLSGKALQGSNLRTSEYAGEVVLLAFWASWCGRCEEQLQQAQVKQARAG
jgi:thiol-disulfide isomerase/thioredoxin